MAQKPIGGVEFEVDSQGRVNSGPLATEVTSAAVLAKMANALLAPGVAIGAYDAVTTSWDNGGAADVDLVVTTYKFVRVTAVEDTYIVVSKVNTDPVTAGEFVPAGSSMMFPCAGCRYVHYKAVTVNGKIGVTAYAAA